MFISPFDDFVAAQEINTAGDCISDTHGGWRQCLLAVRSCVCCVKGISQKNGNRYCTKPWYANSVLQ